MKKIAILLMAITIGFMFCDFAHAHRSEGLLAYFPFNGNADDESGHENHGIAAGAQLTEDAAMNAQGAYEFDGSDEILIPGSAELSIQMFTFTAWIVNKGDDMTNRHIIYKPDCFNLTCQKEMRLAIGLTTTEWDRPKLQSEDLLGNTWQFVAATYDGTLMKLFINAELVEVANFPGLVNSAGVDISIGNDFKGTIDEVRIYNQALSDMEIKDIYNTNSPVPPTPVSYSQSELDDARENARQAAIQACKDDPAAYGITCESLECDDGTVPISDSTCGTAEIDMVGLTLNMHIPNVQLTGFPGKLCVDLALPWGELESLLSICEDK